MADISEKQKLYVLFGILGVAALVFYFNLLLKPQFSLFLRANREFYAIKKKVGSAKVLIANEANINAQYANLKKKSELLEKSFPVEVEVPTILKDFSGIADSSGVDILRIKPLEIPEGEGEPGSSSATEELYSEFPILIEARAGYHQCGLFINKLESTDRFIKIDELDIRGSSSTPKEHDIRLRVITYVMR
jgi:Tfp pilus assembly protein PilO